LVGDFQDPTWGSKSARIVSYYPIWIQAKKQVKTAEILDSLTDAILKHPDVRVRLSVVTVLDKLEDKRALPALKHARDYELGKTDDGYSIRWLAEKAIQRIENRTKGASGIQK
jgi:HEAT repeat protein